MPRAALALLRGWMRLAPRDVRAALELMSRASTDGDVAVTRSACLAVLAVEPEHAAALDKLASCCMIQSEPEKAVELYRRIDALQSGNRPDIPLYESAYLGPA